MNTENYEQVTLPADVVGDQARLSAAGDEGDAERARRHCRSPIELPQRVTLEIVETEPTVKGQTASSSYKPAVLSNGVRTMVPPHIGAGTRIVVMWIPEAAARRRRTQPTLRPPAALVTRRPAALDPRCARAARLVSPAPGS